MSSTQEWCSLDWVAGILDLTRATAMRWARAEKAPATKIRGKWWVTKGNIQAWRHLARQSSASGLSPFCNGCGNDLSSRDLGAACYDCYQGGWR